MKYKIEIWQYQSMTEFYESENIEYIVTWYKSNWESCWEMGECAFDVYKNGEQLSFDEEYELGFY